MLGQAARGNRVVRDLTLLPTFDLIDLNAGPLAGRSFRLLRCIHAQSAASSYGDLSLCLVFRAYCLRVFGPPGSVLHEVILRT